MEDDLKQRILDYKTVLAQSAQLPDLQGKVVCHGDVTEDNAKDFVKLSDELRTKIQQLISDENIQAHNTHAVGGLFFWLGRTQVDQEGIIKDKQDFQALSAQRPCPFRYTIPLAWETPEFSRVSAKYSQQFEKITDILAQMHFTTYVEILPREEETCSDFFAGVNLWRDYVTIWSKMAQFWRSLSVESLDTVTLEELTSLKIPSDRFIQYDEELIAKIGLVVRLAREKRNAAARDVFANLETRAEEIKAETARIAQETQQREQTRQATNRPYCSESFDLYDPTRELEPDQESDDPDGSEGQIVTIIFDTTQPNKRKCFWTKQLEAAGEAQTKIYIWLAAPKSNWSPPPPNQLGQRVYKLPSGEFIEENSWAKLINPPQGTRVFQLEKIPGIIRIGALQHTMSAVWNATDLAVYRAVPVLPRRRRSGDGSRSPVKKRPRQ